jgi:hypothetical protein
MVCCRRLAKLAFESSKTSMVLSYLRVAEMVRPPGW